MRAPGGKPANGGGWLYFGEAPMRPVYIPPPPVPLRPLADIASIDAGCRDAFVADCRNACAIADDLDLSSTAVERLRPGWRNGAWTFPMRDGDGRVVGIRVRAFNSSRKWAVKGSRDGLFFDPGLSAADTVVNGVRGREVVVCEGTTDTAAAYELGLAAVGRSSCATGVQHLVRLCRRLRVTRLTVVADNDQYHERVPGGGVESGIYRPGTDGVLPLVSAVGVPYRLILPPDKDLRGWLRDGLTRREFDRIAATMIFRLPPVKRVG